VFVCNVCRVDARNGNGQSAESTLASNTTFPDPPLAPGSTGSVVLLSCLISSVILHFTGRCLLVLLFLRIAFSRRLLALDENEDSEPKAGNEWRVHDFTFKLSEGQVHVPQTRTPRWFVNPLIKRHSTPVSSGI
jgi:hypothetical protein